MFTIFIFFNMRPWKINGKWWHSARAKRQEVENKAKPSHKREKTITILFRVHQLIWCNLRENCARCSECDNVCLRVELVSSVYTWVYVNQPLRWKSKDDLLLLIFDSLWPDLRESRDSGFSSCRSHQSTYWSKQENTFIDNAENNSGFIKRTVSREFIRTLVTSVVQEANLSSHCWASKG